MVQWMKLQKFWRQDKLHDSGKMQSDMQAMQSGTDLNKQWAKNLGNLAALDGY